MSCSFISNDNYGAIVLSCVCTKYTDLTVCYCCILQHSNCCSYGLKLGWNKSLWEGNPFNCLLLIHVFTPCIYAIGNMTADICPAIDWSNMINSLVPGKCRSNLKSVILEHILVITLQIQFISTSCEIALRWMPQNTLDDMSMSSYYLSQCWPRFRRMLSLGYNELINWKITLRQQLCLWCCCQAVEDWYYNVRQPRLCQ